MHNFAVKNNYSYNNIFQNSYNFQTSNKNFWINSRTAKNSDFQQTEKKQKYKNLSLLIFGGSVLFFSRGAQKKSKIMLEKLKEYVDNRQGKYFFNQSNHRASFLDRASRKINMFIQKTESINNINSIKDILFMKFMYKTFPTKVLHNGVSDFFESLSRKTVIKSYKTTQKNFDKMYSMFEKLDEYILKNFADELVEYNGKKLTKKELIDIAKDKMYTVRVVVNSFIAPSTQDKRYNYIKKSTSTLYNEIWSASFKDFWTKDNKFKRKEMWQTFLAGEQLRGNKTDLADKVAFARNMLSYTDADKKAYTQIYLNNLNSIISSEDTEAVEILERLKWYIQDSSSLVENKENFLKELDKLENKDVIISKNAYISEQKLIEDKNTNIRLLKNIILEDAKGDIEELIDIYRKIAPIELSKSGALSSVKKAVKSFDKSIKLEINEFFDKLRDLEIGSAPTDILTILISFSSIIHGLSNAKNKEEQTSILLRSGIPIVGAVGVTLISAARLLSGGKSLLLGFVSGAILNKIGKSVDEYHKRKQAELSALS